MGSTTSTWSGSFFVLAFLFAVLFAALTFSRTSSFRRRFGRNPWGIPPPGWFVIGLLLGFIGLLLALVACATTRVGPLSTIGAEPQYPAPGRKPGDLGTPEGGTAELGSPEGGPAERGPAQLGPPVGATADARPADAPAPDSPPGVVEPAAPVGDPTAQVGEGATPAVVEPTVPADERTARAEEGTAPVSQSVAEEGASGEGGGSKETVKYPPADWYPDPAGLHELRFWEGTDWSAYVSDSGAVSSDPLPPPTPRREGTSPDA